MSSTASTLPGAGGGASAGGAGPSGAGAGTGGKHDVVITCRLPHQVTIASKSESLFHFRRALRLV